VCSFEHIAQRLSVVIALAALAPIGLVLLFPVGLASLLFFNLFSPSSVVVGHEDAQLSVFF
jgi:membrane protein YdbS with pleckstrin-like domain